MHGDQLNRLEKWLPSGIVALLLFGGVAAAGATDFTWDGACGTTNWYGTCTGDQCSTNPPRAWVYNNWGESACGSDPGPAFPGSADNVFLGSHTVLLTSTTAIHYLTNPAGGVFTISGQPAVFTPLSGLSNGGELVIQDGATLVAGNNTLINDGTLVLRYGGMSGCGILRCDANTLLTGSGAAICECGILSGAGTLTNDAGHTLRGGNGQLAVLIANDGLISADVDNEALVLKTAAKTNSGTMQALNGGYLDIETNITQAPGGVIRADGTDSAVRLYNGADIHGGTLASSGGGALTCGYRRTATFTDVTNLGECRFADGATLAVTGTTLTNAGEIGLYYGGMYGRAFLRFDADVTLAGSGCVYISNGEIDSAAGVSCTNAAGHTIRGGNGYLDAVLTNQGLISANVSAQSLALREQPKENSGVIEATGGGLLDVYVPVTQTVAGEMRVTGAASRVRLHNGASLSGGALIGEDGGLFTCGGAETATFADLTNRAECQFADGARLVVTGTTLTNDGKIGLYYGGMYGNAHLRFDESTVLNGAGEVHVDSGDVATNTGVIVTNGPAHTIHGRGPLNVAMVNEGSIAADWSGQTLTINPQAGGVTNVGQMAVQPGCTLTLNSAGLFAQTAGELRVGGTLNIGSGPLTLAGGVLTGAGTINGGIVSSGATVAPGESVGTLQVNGGYTQGAAGVLRIELGGPGVGEFDRLSVSGTAALDGTLEVDTIGGYYPAVGQQFVIVTAGSVTGGFPTVAGDGQYAVTCTSNQVVLTVLAPAVCRADGNCDGVVSWRDIDYFVAAMNDNVAAWEALFAPGAPACAFANNDANADGTVNWRDIDALVAVMNTVCP